MKGLAGAGVRIDRRVDNCGIQVGAGGVTRLAVWMGRVRITKQRHDPRSIVEVDHGRGGAAGCDDVGLDRRCGRALSRHAHACTNPLVHEIRSILLHG